MEYFRCPPLPICEQLGRQVVSLPSYPTLEDTQIVAICDRLKRLRH
jgi:dTDP-4-amino-4,6-dideoxygalactose transaminase